MKLQKDALCLESKSFVAHPAGKYYFKFKIW